MNPKTSTNYTMEIYSWIADATGPIKRMGQSGYWSITGISPCGNTLEGVDKALALTRSRFANNGTDLSKVRIVVKKIVAVETIEEEFEGAIDFTAYALKTA